jgi:hypothetical protein
MVIGRNSYEDYAMRLADTEVVCPECEGINLNEDLTICYDCSAGDFDNREVSP